MILFTTSPILSFTNFSQYFLEFLLSFLARGILTIAAMTPPTIKPKTGIKSKTSLAPRIISRIRTIFTIE
jgi:hypothetical protein